MVFWKGMCQCVKAFILPFLVSPWQSVECHEESRFVVFWLFRSLSKEIDPVFVTQLLNSVSAFTLFWLEDLYLSGCLPS